MVDYSERSVTALTAAGADPDEVRDALRILTAFTLGYAGLTAGGYLEATTQGSRPSANDGAPSSAPASRAEADIDTDFERCLSLVLSSVAARLA
jgi:hypothetical protein